MSKNPTRRRQAPPQEPTNTALPTPPAKPPHPDPDQAQTAISELEAQRSLLGSRCVNLRIEVEGWRNSYAHLMGRSMELERELNAAKAALKAKVEIKLAEKPSPEQPTVVEE